MISNRRFGWSLFVVATVLLVFCYFAGFYQAKEKVMKPTPDMDWLEADFETVNLMTEHISTSSDIEKRGKWQKQQVETYCRKYGLTELKYQFPSDKGSKARLFTHVVFDDPRKFIFTLVPKVGSMSTVRFMCQLYGPLPPKGNLKGRTFKLTTMNDSQKLERVKNYYKVTTIRNPLERLLSAFKDKFEDPLKYNHHKYMVGLRMDILRKFGNVEELKRWQSGNRSTELLLTFPQYIRWVVNTNNSLLNDHFAPQIEDIYPCRMVHDFYGNFKQLGKDMAMIIKKIGAPMEYYPNTSYHDPSYQTGHLLEQYYSQVSKELKHALFRDFYQELDFYYHLYPEERTSHCKLLETDELIL